MQLTVCDYCGIETSFQHDHRPDSLGLDDGPEINPARKRPSPKPAAVVAEIRKRAWETRRVKYGQYGHR